MEGTKGIHAIGTSLFAVLLLYFSWDMFTHLNSNLLTDNLGRAVLWGAYLLALLLTIVIAPLVIAFRDDSDVSFLSAMGGFMAYCCSALLFVGTWEFFNTFTSAVLTNTVFNQLVWLFIALLYFTALYLAPLFITFYPETAKKLIPW